ncbi:N-acetylmuramoyl-L-alanine amidase family protein, partial [Chamaesiphon polymorphus]
MKLRSWMAIASLFLISLSLVLVSVDRGNAIVIAQSQPSVCQERISPVTQIDPNTISIGEVAIESGIARTGAHDDCQRVTPLPQGTRARIVAQTTGPDRFKQIVPWYQLDYGAWIEASAVSILTTPVTTQATISAADVRADTAKTELVLPLSAPVPFEIQQTDRGFGITLYNTTGSISQLNLQPAIATATPTSPSLAISSSSSPSPASPTAQPLQWAANKFLTLPTTGIATASWQAPTSDRVQINLQLRAQQQWGYQTAYRNNNLVITLRNPPQLSRNPQKPLSGLTVVVDPGHGGIDSGAVGRAYGNTYLEKTVNMQVSEYLQQALIDRGANVVMTRTTDINPSLDDRQVIINRTLPVVSISIHHDAG